MIFNRVARVARRLSASISGRWMSGSTAATGSTMYEGQRAVDEYVQMHFGSPSEVFPYTGGAADGLAFPERCAGNLVDAVRERGDVPANASALDVGCAVGGASFALARSFSRVDGVDFSSAFVEAAQAMQREGHVEYEALLEGSRCGRRVAALPAGERTAQLAFAQGDACDLEALRSSGNLRAEGYDAVLASNLLCRLPRPRAFLLSCADWIVRPGGSLVLLTPFSWLEQWTAREEWIGGGDTNSSEALLTEMTSLGFILSKRTDAPFLIREHARKFQYGVSECTTWVKE